MLYPQIHLKRGKAESLRRFHPWVFSGAIHSLPRNMEEGQLVEVFDDEGHYVATGHWQIGSIAVRVLTFRRQEITRDFWLRRIRQAYLVRQTLGLIRPDNNAYRLVHGEGDRLPGLVVDMYADTAVVQAHSVGMHIVRQTIAEVLCEVTGVHNIYYKSETTLPFKADLHQQNGFLIGGAPGIEAVGTENGLRFNIDWLRGQKTGFFVDQRDNRSLVEHYSRGRRVLNMFCYTGGFSVYALRGDAACVHSVDSSAKAVELVNANVALNFPGDPRHEAFCEDAFKFLEHIPEASRKEDTEKDGDSAGAKPYDLIILDPPAFAKHKDALRNALKGYTRLNAVAFQKIAPGGILFTFSCSQAVNKEQFRLAVFTAAAMSGRHVRILHQLHQPADHPVNIYHPEGEYLKGLVLQVE